MVDYGSLFVAEKLRLDGSNFVKWYLNTHAQLYVLDEPLEECPIVSASYEKYMEWSEQKTTYLKVEWMMCALMNSDLSSQFHNLSTMEIVDELKERLSTS